MKRKKQVRRYKRGPEASHWKGGRVFTHGYVRAYAPEHPHKDQKGYVYEHRLVIEKALGRYLSPLECIHHINGNGEDNRLDNLLLFGAQGEHISFHALAKRQGTDLQAFFEDAINGVEGSQGSITPSPARSCKLQV